MSEIVLLYPSLIGALAQHPGIGLVVGREGDRVSITGQRGTLWVGPETTQTEGQDPLSEFPDPEWAREQLVRLARFPHAGDLILLGRWDGNVLISFEDQAGSHGGLGGPQEWPFLAFPPGSTLSPREIRNAEDLYGQLAGQYMNSD